MSKICGLLNSGFQSRCYRDQDTVPGCFIREHYDVKPATGIHEYARIGHSFSSGHDGLTCEKTIIANHILTESGAITLRDYIIRVQCNLKKHINSPSVSLIELFFFIGPNLYTKVIDMSLMRIIIQMLKLLKIHFNWGKSHYIGQKNCSDSFITEEVSRLKFFMRISCEISHIL